MEEKDIETKNKLLESFHEQFSQNQNHSLETFVKLITSLIVVITGYFWVYINMNSHNDSCIVYTFTHLTGAYYLAQIILVVLIGICFSNAINLRRDLKVVFQIRRKFLNITEYDEIFGNSSFKPNKSLCDYLPGPNFVFYLGILSIQTVVFFSFLMEFISKWENQSFIEKMLSVTSGIPVLLTPALYVVYYCKYQKSCIIKYKT